MGEMTGVKEELKEAIIKGKRDVVEPLIRKALSEGLGPEEIMDKMMIPAMDVVGDRFSRNEIFLPEMMIAARAMNTGLEILRPILAAKGVSSKGKVVIGTVKGDLHDIGKNLVAMMLESAGFEVCNLGVDVSPEKFVAEIKARDANLLCLSALLTTTMPMMKKTIDATVAAGLRDRVKVLIGGAPVTQQFAGDIGADGYAPDAGSAVKAAKAILQ